MRCREEGQYLIIDDEDWAGQGHPDGRLIQTGFKTGFRHSHFQKATTALPTRAL
jgi:hypothetical protein